MNEAPESPADEERKPSTVLVRLSEMGASAQAAIPGLYAWAITVAPAAWGRGGPRIAKVASIFAVIALTTAPILEARGRAMWGRIWSVWGFVLPCAVVWALSPSALSSARFDSVRGVLGTVGWALFAFASAGPTLRANKETERRAVASSSLKPRAAIPRGDGVYIAVGATMAIGLQTIGWGVTVPERAVLVRLVTIVCGIAVIGATTSIALARHQMHVPASKRLRMRRALPWFVLLALFVGSGVAFSIVR